LACALSRSAKAKAGARFSVFLFFAKWSFRFDSDMVTSCLRRLEVIMKSVLKSVAAALTLFLAGCFEATGVHIVAPYGQPDSGGYRIWMSDYAWSEMTRTPEWPELDARNRTFSNPQIYRENGGVVYQDMDGDVAMENWYDSVDCNEVSGGRAVCHFTMYVDAESIRGWTLNWGVAVSPGMRVVSSNHHRSLAEGSTEILVWDFNGNQSSQVAIDFTLNVPVSRY
jgi:hypothetical protein